MKIKPQTAILITLVIFIAGIILTSAAGLRNAESGGGHSGGGGGGGHYTEEYEHADSSVPAD